MPVSATKKNGMWIVADKAGKKIPSSVKTKSKKKAMQQAAAVNASLHEQGKI